jgi:hypothetical protein
VALFFYSKFSIQIGKIQRILSHLRGLAFGDRPSPRRCAFIESKVNNFALRFGDFSEIDTRGGARDFQSRRPTPPRAYYRKQSK